MIRNVWRVQWTKLFSSIEYIGFNIIGALITFFYGMVVLLNESDDLGFENILQCSLSHSFPALLFFCICIFGCTYVKEYENKTVNYEKMHDVGTYAFILGRMLVPIMNTFIFTIVILGMEIIGGKIVGCCDEVFISTVIMKVILTFICILRLNIMIALYFIGTETIWGGSIITLLTQWGVPLIVAKTNTFSERIGDEVIQSICYNQFSAIWREDILQVYGRNTLLCMCIELLMVFF